VYFIFKYCKTPSSVQCVRNRQNKIKHIKIVVYIHPWSVLHQFWISGRISFFSFFFFDWFIEKFYQVHTQNLSVSWGSSLTQNIRIPKNQNSVISFNMHTWGLFLCVKQLNIELQKELQKRKNFRKNQFQSIKNRWASVYM